MKNNHKPRSPIKFRPKAGKKSVDDLLNPDVLDDETRKMLLKEVMRPPPANMEGVPPRVHYTSPSSEQALKKHLKEQRTAGTSADGTVDVRTDYPSQFRSRVSNSSDDLVTVMSARLNALEKKQKVYELELNEMRGKHQALNEKYQEEVKKREEAENVVVTLYEEKKELEHALDDMIQFLSDYGLEWKGGDALKKGRASRSPSEQSEGAKFDLYEGDFSPVTPRDGEDSPRSQDSGPINFNNTAGKGKKLFNAKEIPHSLKENEEKRRESVGKDKADMKPVDVPLLIRNARILSDYVGYKDNYVEGNRGGIRNRDVVKLAVYANGIVVNNGPFRPFGWPLCDAFLKDLEEGFYPYEFKEKYPSGFPIEVLDKSTEKWEAPKSSAAAAGGRRLGGNVHTLDDDREGKPITKEELLQKLPAQRITEGGKIVNMRADIAKMLGGEADGGSAPVPMGTVKHVSTAENEFRGEKEGANAAKEAGKGEVFVDGLISILLRLPNGQKVTIKMHPSSTILDLRKEFSLAVPEYKNKKYELCQTFPSLTFDDHTKTLESLGFVRSCTLMVRLD